MFCLDFNNVAIQPGVDMDESNVRICLPYMNIQIEIGDETPFVWPPQFLRHSETGAVLLNEDGTPLQI